MTLREVLKKNGKKIYTLYCSLLFIGAFFSVAYAENDWGENILAWVKKQAIALSVVAILVIIVPMIAKKMWALLVGTIFIGSLALYFVANPDKFTTIGNAIFKIIFGG